ncbi:hypothetical protein LWI28_009852 [Acer negundo]|uniref:Uncharacterized protein n=1 Tax=Acer negundo TaxID=4023 RepID=A0AAD5P013_ACENE|nr:hypothetical protein LWI28_009852 [Acer negundo]
MDPLAEQMANFNKGMSSFTLRASRVMESHVKEAEGTRVQEGDIDNEMKSNLQVMQATYEKLLNGFMEASQDRFSKLEKSVNRIDGHLWRIADKLLSGNIGSSRDSLNLGIPRAILRSGRIVNNGRNEEIAGESNNSPRERKDEEKRIPVQEDIEGGRIQIPNECCYSVDHRSSPLNANATSSLFVSSCYRRCCSTIRLLLLLSSPFAATLLFVSS